MLNTNFAFSVWSSACESGEELWWLCDRHEVITCII